MTSHRIIPLPEPKFYRGFSLDIENPYINLLPDEHELVLNTQSGHFILINWDTRYIVADGTFSKDELSLMIAVLEAWPTYVPREKLLATVTQQPIEEIYELLDIDHDQALEPLHQLVDACRKQMHRMNLDIQDIAGAGYKLSRYHDRKGEVE